MKGATVGLLTGIGIGTVLLIGMLMIPTAAGQMSFIPSQAAVTAQSVTIQTKEGPITLPLSEMSATVTVMLPNGQIATVPLSSLAQWQGQMPIIILQSPPQTIVKEKTKTKVVHEEHHGDHHGDKDKHPPWWWNGHDGGGGKGDKDPGDGRPGKFTDHERGSSGGSSGGGGSSDTSG